MDDREPILCLHGEPHDECQKCVDLELQQAHDEWWEDTSPGWWEELKEIENLARPRAA